MSRHPGGALACRRLRGICRTYAFFWLQNIIQLINTLRAYNRYSQWMLAGSAFRGCRVSTMLALLFVSADEQIACRFISRQCCASAYRALNTLFNAVQRRNHGTTKFGLRRSSSSIIAEWCRHFCVTAATIILRRIWRVYRSIALYKETWFISSQSLFHWFNVR